MDPSKDDTHNNREGKNRSSSTTSDSPIQRRPPPGQQYDSSPRNNDNKNNNNSNNKNNNESNTKRPQGMNNNSTANSGSNSRGRSASAGAAIGGGFPGAAAVAAGVFGGRPPVLGPAGTQLLRTADGGVAMAYLIPAAVGGTGGVGVGGQSGSPFIMTPTGRITDFIDPVTGAIFRQSASSSNNERHTSNSSKNNTATTAAGTNNDSAQLIQTLNFALQQQHQQHRNRMNPNHPKIHDLSESSNRYNREERHSGSKKGSNRLQHHQQKRRSVETIEIDTTKDDDDSPELSGQDEIIDLTDREHFGDGVDVGYTRQRQHHHHHERLMNEKLSSKESKKRARLHHHYHHQQRSEGGKMYRSRSEEKLSSKKRKLVEASPKRKPITINDDDDDDDEEEVDGRNNYITDLTKHKDDDENDNHGERKQKGTKSQPAAVVDTDNIRLGTIAKILRGDSELARTILQPIYVTMDDIAELSRRINNSDSTSEPTSANNNDNTSPEAATTTDVLTERRIQDETIQSLNKQHAGQLSLIANNEKIIEDLQQQIEMNKSYPLLVKKQAIELDALRTKLASLERSRLIREKEESMISNEQQRIVRSLEKIVNKLTNELKQEKIRGDQGINAFVQASNKSLEILRDSGHYLT